MLPLVNVHQRIKVGEEETEGDVHKASLSVFQVVSSDCPLLAIGRMTP